MKILSKYKDYYDYLQGVYGIDEKIFYDRRDIKLKDKYSEPEYKFYVFAINNKLYKVILYKGKYYSTPEEWLELDKIFREDNKKLNIYSRLFLPVLGVYRAYTDKEKLKIISEYFSDNYTIINKELRKPVLLYISKDNYIVPLLKEYNFHKVLTAEEVYQEIYNFISWTNDHPEIPNKQTDKEKIISHGFDTKKSFRHRK